MIKNIISIIMVIIMLGIGYFFAKEFVIHIIPEEVCVPLHVNLKESRYEVISVDTIYTTNINYKKITYKEKSPCYYK